jgi:hypothetical protein
MSQGLSVLNPLRRCRVGGSVANYELELLDIFQRIFDDLWRELEPRIERGEADEQRSELARLIVLAHRRGVSLKEIKAAVLAELQAK